MKITLTNGFTKRRVCGSDEEREEWERSWSWGGVKVKRQVKSGSWRSGGSSSSFKSNGGETGQERGNFPPRDLFSFGMTSLPIKAPLVPTPGRSSR